MLIPLLMLLVLLLFPHASVQGAIRGLRLCASAVIPSLFPFFIITRLLPQIKCKHLANMMRLSEATCSALLVSFLGGYPIGVARICAMYENGEIEKNEAQQAILFCNNSGPGFFIGMIGTVVLCNVKLGIVLYAIHVLGAILCAYIFKPKQKSYGIKRKIANGSFSERFTTAITASCEGMLNVCAMVVLFSILMNVISSFPIPFTQASKTLLFGVLELTSGISMCCDNFVICAFLMGWGGFCVHMQAISLWKKQGLNVKGYFTAKLLHGLISAIFALAYRRSIFYFACSIIAFIIFVVIFRIFLKFGVEKKENMLYNTFER